MKSRPDAWAELADHGVAIDVVQDSLAGPFRRAWRRHPLRGCPTGWGESESLPWSPLGAWHPAEIDPSSRLDYHTGCIYPQNAASQVPVLLLDPQPGEVVVDCCAAPGSKTTQIGLALGNHGLVIAGDAAPDRRRIIGENCQRQGLSCVLVTPMPVAALARRHGGCADAVLVDAPCSGHTPPQAATIARNVRRQRSILASAAALLRPGGRMVYSTCTPWVAENEGVIRQFLADNPEFVVEPMQMPGLDADLAALGGVRLWPHRQGSEPFFAIRLRRQGHGERTTVRGEQPALASPDPGWPNDIPLWQAQSGVVLGSEMAMSAALPAESRGLRLRRQGEDRLHPWAAQALISRGANAAVVTHDHGRALWAGEVAGPASGLLKTEHGAPLGWADGDGRLQVPSRLRCQTMG